MVKDSWFVCARLQGIAVAGNSHALSARHLQSKASEASTVILVGKKVGRVDCKPDPDSMRMPPFGCSSLDNSFRLYDIEQHVQFLEGAKAVIFNTLLSRCLKVSVDTFSAQQIPTPSICTLGYSKSTCISWDSPTTHTNKS